MGGYHAEQIELASLAEQFDEIAGRIEDYAEADPAIDADETEHRNVLGFC